VFLFHSLLTPALNIGLISPQEVIDAALERADCVPLNRWKASYGRSSAGASTCGASIGCMAGGSEHAISGTTFADARRLLRRHDRIEPVDTVIRRVLRTPTVTTSNGS